MKRGGPPWKARRGGLSGKAELYRDDPDVGPGFAPVTRAEFEDYQEARLAAHCLNLVEKMEPKNRKGGPAQR